MIEPEIIYEDENFLAVNKPAGLLVHIANQKLKTENLKLQETTLVDWLVKRYPEIQTVGDDPVSRPGIVHRLDKETSGIIVIAKNQKYFEHLKEIFKTRQIKKKYVALLHGSVVPEKGTIEKPIGIKDGTIKRSVHSQKMVKDAVTKYKVIQYLKLSSEGGSSFGGKTGNLKLKTKEAFSLVEVEPLTGRTHQIRVHMASIGHPVVGDALYGPRTNKRMKRGLDVLTASRLMLHALSIEFTSDSGKRLRLQADYTQDYLDVLSRLD